ncbi:MAG: hypothetical protein WCD45_01745, partial [Gallionella sp.]
MNTTLFKSSQLHLALVAALGLTLAACGGSSTGSGTAALTGVVSGKAVDGYLSGAIVTLDKNDSGTCGDTVNLVADISQTTDAAGNFAFKQSDGNHLICASGGTDITTGKPFVGQIQAPPGSTQITPLTNLIVQQFQAANPGVPMVSSTGVINAGVATAQTTVQTNLGIAAGTNVLTTDPTTNTALSATTTAVQQLVQQITTALASAAGVAPTATQQAALYASVAKQVTTLVAAAPVNLTSISAATTLAASAVTASVASVGTALGITQPTINGTNLANIVSASVGQTVQGIAAATSASAVALASTNAVTTGTTSLATLVSNNASSVASTTTGLTNIIAGAGIFVNGVQATAPVAGGIKSVSTAAGSGVQTATLNFGAITGTLGISNPISVAVDVSSTTLGDNRSLQAAITGLTLNNNAGVLSITATSGVTAATAYGKNTAGTTANISSSN